MLNVGVLTARLEAQLGSYERAMRQAEEHINKVERAAQHAERGGLARFNQRLDQASQSLNKVASAARGVGMAAGVALTGLVGLGAGFVKVASDAAELENVIQQGFGPLANQINEWADATGKSMGRSSLQMRKFAGTMQAMLRPMVGSTNRAAEMSKEITRLAVDMGSFWNILDDDALVALRSALVGETEPMRRFGVVLTEAQLQAFAFERGINKSVQAMSEAEKVTLRYQFIMDRTRMVQGDAERTAGSFANQMKALRADITNISEDFGKFFIPVAQQFVAVVRGATSALSDMDPTQKRVIAQWALFSAAVLAGTVALSGVLIVLPQLVKGLRIVMGVFALFASPWVLATVAIIAALLALKLAWDENWGGMRDTVNAAWAAIQPTLDAIAAAFSPLVEAARQAVLGIKSVWADEDLSFGEKLMETGKVILRLGGFVFEWAGQMFTTLADAFARWWQGDPFAKQMAARTGMEFPGATGAGERIVLGVRVAWEWIEGVGESLRRWLEANADFNQDGRFGFADIWAGVTLGLKAVWEFTLPVRSAVQSFLNAHADLNEDGRFTFLDLFAGVTLGVKAAWEWTTGVIASVRAWLGTHADFNQDGRFTLLDIWAGLVLGLRATWDFTLPLRSSIQGFLDGHADLDRDGRFNLVDVYAGVVLGLKVAWQWISAAGEAVAGVGKGIKTWLDAHADFNADGRFTFTDIWAGIVLGVRAVWDWILPVRSSVQAFLNAHADLNQDGRFDFRDIYAGIILGVSITWAWLTTLLASIGEWLAEHADLTGDADFDLRDIVAGVILGLRATWEWVEGLYESFRRWMGETAGLQEAESVVQQFRDAWESSAGAAIRLAVAIKWAAPVVARNLMPVIAVALSRMGGLLGAVGAVLAGAIPFVTYTVAALFILDIVWDLLPGDVKEKLATYFDTSLQNQIKAAATGAGLAILGAAVGAGALPITVVATLGMLLKLVNWDPVIEKLEGLWERIQTWLDDLGDSIAAGRDWITYDSANHNFEVEWGLLIKVIPEFLERPGQKLGEMLDWFNREVLGMPGTAEAAGPGLSLGNLFGGVAEATPRAGPIPPTVPEKQLLTIEQVNQSFDLLAEGIARAEAAGKTLPQGIFGLVGSLEILNKRIVELGGEFRDVPDAIKNINLSAATQSEVQALVERIAREVGVDPALAIGVAGAESSLRDISHLTATASGAIINAIGPLQVTAAAVAELEAAGKTVDLTTIEGRVRAGVEFLKLTMEKYPGILQRASERLNITLQEALVIAHMGIGFLDRLQSLNTALERRLANYKLFSGRVAAAEGLTLTFPGHQSGGFTGEGIDDLDDIAGVVHEHEWVAPQWMLKQQPSMFRWLENARKRGSFKAGGSPDAMPLSVKTASDVEKKTAELYAQNEAALEEMGKVEAALKSVSDALKPVAQTLKDLLTSLAEQAKEVPIIGQIVNAIQKLIEAMSLIGQDIENAADLMAREMSARERREFGLRERGQTMIAPTQWQIWGRRVELEFEKWIVRPIEGVIEAAAKRIQESKFGQAVEGVMGNIGKAAAHGGDLEAFAEVLDDINPATADAIREFNGLLQTLNDFPDTVKALDAGFLTVQKTVSDLFGGGGMGNILGRIAGGVAGWNAFSQGTTGTNWAGGIAGALSGAGIGAPFTTGIALASNLVNTLFPGKPKSQSDQALQKQIRDMNDMLEEWGATFRSPNVSFQKDTGFLGWRSLFGNEIWTTAGKEAAERGAEIAEQLIQSMQATFNNLGPAVGAVLFDGMDLSAFTQAVGSQVQRAFIEAILEAGPVADAMKQLSAMIAEAMEGGLTAAELTAIKEAAGGVFSQIEPLQGIADMIAEEFGLAADEVERMSAALVNVPTGFKVEALRYAAMEPVPQMAAGGIVTRPITALIGEAGPEAVLPLDEMEGVINRVEHVFPPTAPFLRDISRMFADREETEEADDFIQQVEHVFPPMPPFGPMVEGIMDQFAEAMNGDRQRREFSRIYDKFARKMEADTPEMMRGGILPIAPPGDEVVRALSDESTERPEPNKTVTFGPGSVTIVSNDPEKIWRELKRIMERENTRGVGTVVSPAPVFVG